MSRSLGRESLGYRLVWRGAGPQHAPFASDIVAIEGSSPPVVREVHFAPFMRYTHLHPDTHPPHACVAPFRDSRTLSVGERPVQATTIAGRTTIARSVGNWAALSMFTSFAFLGCAAQTDSGSKDGDGSATEPDDAEVPTGTGATNETSSAAEDPLRVGDYVQVGTSVFKMTHDEVTFDKKGGREVRCGQVDNTSPYQTTMFVAYSYSASAGITGGLNATAVKEYLSAALSINVTLTKTYSSSATVMVPPGKRAVLYCYAIGNYYSGTASLHFPITTPVQRARYTAFVPHSLGFRMSYY